MLFLYVFVSQVLGLRVGRDYEEVVELEKEEFILVILRLHQVNSRRKWRIMVKNTHEKEIVKMFVGGLKPEVFREEMYSRSFETLVGGCETRHELPNYRDIIEISERIKRPEVK